MNAYPNTNLYDPNTVIPRSGTTSPSARPSLPPQWRAGTNNSLGPSGAPPAGGGESLAMARNISDYRRDLFGLRPPFPSGATCHLPVSGSLSRRGRSLAQRGGNVYVSAVQFCPQCPDLSGVWDFRFNADEPWRPLRFRPPTMTRAPTRSSAAITAWPTTARPSPCPRARRVLRFDAVTHNAVVRLNGQEIASHRGELPPFEADITALAQPGETVTLDVEVDNRIGHSSLPVGNEGGTAFFGSDNAGIPPSRPARRASRLRASTCRTLTSSTMRASPARCTSTRPRRPTSAM